MPFGLRPASNVGLGPCGGIAADTFRPINPSDFLASTNPTLSTPAAKRASSCQRAVVVIVAIVVTLAVAAAIGPQGAGLVASKITALSIGSFVGSVASQGVAVAMGMQDKINWRSAVVSALAAGATAGVGSGNVGSLMLQSAVNNVTSQGIAMLFGVQDRFDWRSVAVAAFTTGISEGLKLNGAIANGVSGVTNSAFAADFFKNAAQNTLRQGLRIAVDGKGKMDWAMVAADSFGNALGNSIVADMEDQKEIRVANNARKAMEAEASSMWPHAKVTKVAYQVETVPGTVSTLTEELAKLGAINMQATELAKMLNDPVQRDVMAQQLGGADKLAQFERAYQDNLKSEDSYLSYESADLGMQQKVAAMKESLSAFKISRVSDQDITAGGLDINVFRYEESGFYAALYHNGGDDSYTVAFRGTEFSLNDIQTDVLNALGYETEQFRQAADLAQMLSLDTEFSRGLSFTGHSLGGGLATLAAARTRLSANTFNAASVHPGVAARLDAPLQGIDNRVRAFSLDGDIVSGLQDNPLLDVVAGVLTPLKWVGGLLSGQPTLELGYLPQAAGERIVLPGWRNNQWVSSWGSQLMNSFGLHSNQTFLQSFYQMFRGAPAPQGAYGSGP